MFLKEIRNSFVSATNVSPFARSRKCHEKQCFRNNVSSFATAFMSSTDVACGGKKGNICVRHNVSWLTTMATLETLSNEKERRKRG